MSTQTAPVTGVAAGVPFLALPPAGPAGESAPVVVGWHLMDPPCTESAFAAALPMSGLAAWRVYLGLPLCGSRLPAGGADELLRLSYEDAVQNVQGPIATQAAEEFPAALGELRDRLGLGSGPLGLLGGSIGSAVALLVLAGTGPAAGLRASAALLVSPISQLRPAVDATGRRYGVSYPWGPASLEIARRMDFVARAGEIVRNGQPAVRLVVGADDDPEGFGAPARRLRAALSDRYDDPSKVDVVVVPGMGHPLAEAPGIDPAPQTPSAAAVDRHAVDWFHRHLVAAPAPAAR